MRQLVASDQEIVSNLGITCGSTVRPRRTAVVLPPQFNSPELYHTSQRSRDNGARQGNLEVPFRQTEYIVFEGQGVQSNSTTGSMSARPPSIPRTGSGWHFAFILPGRPSPFTLPQLPRPLRTNKMYMPPPSAVSAQQEIAMIPRQSFDVWKGVLVALYAVGAVITLFRLSGRVWQIRTAKLSLRRELWTVRSLDDYLALAAAFWGVVASVVMVDLYLEKDTHLRIPYQKGLYYVMSVAWTSALWLPRIALCLTFWGRGSQLIHYRISRLGLGLAVCFTFVYLSHGAGYLATGCAHHGRVSEDVQTTAYCNTGKQGLTVILFIGLFFSELSLIAVSAYALVTSKQPASQDTPATERPQSAIRATYCSILSASIVLLLITVAHCAFQYSPLVTGTDGLLVKDMSAQLEAALSIMACNTPALVALFRRVAYGEPNPMNTGISSSGGLARVSVIPDLKVPVTVLPLAELSAASREKDRKLGLDYAESDSSSVKSGRSL